MRNLAVLAGVGDAAPLADMVALQSAPHGTAENRGRLGQRASQRTTG